MWARGGAVGALLLLLAGAVRGNLSWGPNCSFTPVSQVATAEVRRSTTYTLARIPKGKRNVFVQVASSSDLDLRLATANGTVLLAYGDGDDDDGSGAHWCVDCAVATVWTHRGMTLSACVDGCAASAAWTDHAGVSFSVSGDASYSSEWVFIDTVVETLTLQVTRGTLADARRQACHVVRLLPPLR